MDFRTRAVCLIPLLLPLALLIGCSNSNSQPMATEQGKAPSATPNSWTIMLSISGGFAGMRRQITIEENGKWQASDRRLGHKAGKLTVEQLAKLEKTVMVLEDTPPQSGPSFPGRCADCIEMKMDATVDGKSYKVTTHSGDGLAQPYANLLSQILPLIQESFSQK